MERKRAVESAEIRVLRHVFSVKLAALAFVCDLHRLAAEKVPELALSARDALIESVRRNVRRDGILPEQVAASKLLLDMLVPGWAKTAPDLFGYVADRDSPEYAEWRNLVLARDVRCLGCGADKELHAHHIVPWIQSPALRFDLGNGATLCRACHIRQHQNMGIPVWNRLVAA